MKITPRSVHIFFNLGYIFNFFRTYKLSSKLRYILWAMRAQWN